MKKEIRLLLWIWITLGLLSGCGAPQEEPLVTSTDIPIPTFSSSATPEPTEEPTLPPTLEPTEAQVQDPVFALNLDISEGTYQDDLYTPETGIFTCNFGNVINAVPYPNLFDSKEGENYGAVWSLDGYGQSFAIDYFRYSALSTDRKELLEDSQTREEGYLKLYTDMLLPYHLNTFPGLEILDQGFIDEETLYVVWNKPQGSHLFTNNV